MRYKWKKKALLVTGILLVLLCTGTACKKEEKPDTPENVTLAPGNVEGQDGENSPG